MNTPLLDIIDAANLLSISTRRVSAFVRNGTLPYVLLPNKEIRFVESDLKDWIESRKRSVAETEKKGGTSHDPSDK